MYVIDTSSLIEAWRRYYAPDIAPTFWRHLYLYNYLGQIAIIDRVKNEINRGTGNLSVLMNRLTIVPTNGNNILNEYQNIMKWASRQMQYTLAAKSNFARFDNADAWIIAYAISGNHIVVSEEKPAPQSKNSIKIPDVCKVFRVVHIDTFEMMRQLSIVL